MLGLSQGISWVFLGVIMGYSSTCHLKISSPKHTISCTQIAFRKRDGKFCLALKLVMHYVLKTPEGLGHADAIDAVDF